MDRRIRRTRTAVFNAVLDLMVEKDTSKITVLELCKRADINKSTFYLHYKSMEDCLQNCFQIIMNGIIDISKKIKYDEIKHNPQIAVDKLLDEVERNIDYLSKFKSSSICAPAIKMLKENLKTVEERIQSACKKAGRKREEITLIAVSKTKPVEMLQEAYDLGVRINGENKAQELASKYEVLPKDIHWHMIGHMQRNKVKYIIDKVDLIHSVDSVRLAETIDKEAEKHGVIANILIEVNVAKEESKFGLMPEEVPEFVEKIAGFPHIRVKGLMTIAPFVENPEENRPIFAHLRKLSVDIAKKNIDNITMSILSMGMTNDYQVAIEEGATMVRVGTGIFGARDYTHQV